MKKRFSEEQIIGFGSRECTAEEAPGGIAAGDRGHPRGAAKRVVTAPTRREVVLIMKARGMTERHALRAVGMSASALRYQPAPDRNGICESRSCHWPSATSAMAPR